MTVDYEGGEINSEGFEETRLFFVDWLARHYPDIPLPERNNLAVDFVDEVIIYFTDYLKGRKPYKQLKKNIQEYQGE